MGERCEICRFWRRITYPSFIDNWGDDIGVCHRYPPQPATDIEYEGYPLGKMRRISEAYWCGEYRARQA